MIYVYKCKLCNEILIRNEKIKNSYCSKHDKKSRLKNIKLNRKNFPCNEDSGCDDCILCNDDLSCKLEVDKDGI